MARSGPVREEWSAGGVVVRTIAGRHHILLIRDPYGQWGLPKGHVEAGEEPHAAALREVREETGLEELTLGPFLRTIDWWFQSRGRAIHKHCRFFLMASANGDVRPEAEEGITACTWYPVERARRAIGYDNARSVVREAESRLAPPDGAFPPWK